MRPCHLSNTHWGDETLSFHRESFASDVSQSSEVSIPKLDFFSLQPMRSKVTSSNHRCPMSLERCLEGLVPVAKALNVLQGLPQNTGCKHPDKRLGHGLDMFGHLVRIGGTFVAGTLTQAHILHRIIYNVIQCLQLPLSSQPLSAALSHSQLLWATHASLSYATLSYSQLQLLPATLATLLSATLASLLSASLLWATLRNASRTSQLCEKKCSSNQVFSYQFLTMMVCMQTFQPLSKKKWRFLVRLRVVTYQHHRITGLCTCCRFLFSHT